MQYLQLSLQLDTVVLLSFHLRPDMALLSLLLVLAPMFIFTVTLDLHPSVLHLPTYTPSPKQIQYILVANRLVAVQGGLMLILIVTLDVHPGVVHLATNTPSSGLDQCILSSKKLFLGLRKNMFAKFPIEISSLKTDSNEHSLFLKHQRVKNVLYFHMYVIKMQAKPRYGLCCKCSIFCHIMSMTK